MNRGRLATVWAASAAACIALVVLVPVGVRLWDVHLLTSDWTLTPKEVPSKVQYGGREFNCGPDAKPNPGRTLDGLTVRGRTAGGADIYAGEPHPESRRRFSARVQLGLAWLETQKNPWNPWIPGVFPCARRGT
jgi:hypothetical protein